MRTIEELRDVDDPAWPVIEEAIAGAYQPAQIIAGDRAAGEHTLLLLEVTAHSFLEAPIHRQSVDQPPDEPPGQVLVACDVLGGKFAIDGGAIPGSPGEVSYFAADDVAWLTLEMKFSEFVLWSLTDNLGMFYEHLRWPGWEAEIAPLALDQGLNLVSPPFTTEGHACPRLPADPSQSPSS